MSTGNPPEFDPKVYSIDLGENWSMHADGQWLYNITDGVFFHINSNQILPVCAYMNCHVNRFFVECNKAPGNGSDG